MSRTIATAFIASIALLAGSAARADTPGAHPAFLHALSDLRAARAHLEKPANPTIKWDEKKAIHFIDAAIGEIKKAAIDDGKNLDDHPPVDAGLDHKGRLHRSLDLLRKARKDIEEKESDKFAHGLRHRAFDHIDHAIREIKKAVGDT